MPTYKVTQKQGNRTMTSTIEAKSLASLKAFLDQISTAKTTCIYEVHYENDTDTPPIDDFNYFKQFKAMARNKKQNITPNFTTQSKTKFTNRWHNLRFIYEITKAKNQHNLTTKSKSS